MTSGLLQENSFNVITLNPESNCTCREKNHFLFRWSTSTLPEQHKHHWTWPGGWGPQGVRPTGGGGLARVPNLRVCDHLFSDGGGTRRRRANWRPCRGTVQSAWQKTSSETQGGRAGLPVRVSGRHAVLGWQFSPTLECAKGNRQGGQNSGEMGGSSPWTRPSAPGCGDTLKAPASDQRPIQGGDRPRRRLRGRYRLGHRPVVLLRTETDQCVRAWPSVVVDSKKVLREADGAEERDSTKKSTSRWKGDRPWVCTWVRAREAGREPEDHKRLMEKNVEDYWNVDGEKELSDAWTGFTRVILLDERPPDGYTWSGRRLTRKQTTSRPDNVWRDVWKHMSDAAKKKAKQRWAIEKPKFDNARQIRGIFCIEPDFEEFRHHENATAVPCKTPLGCRGETCRNTWETQDQICLYCPRRRLYDNTMWRCAAQVSRRSYLCKRNKFIEPYYNLVHEFIPMPQAMKIPAANAAVDKEWENKRKYRHGSWRRSETKMRWKVHFASLMDLCHLKNSELEPRYQKYKGRVVLRGYIVKDDSGSYAVFTEQGSSASLMTAAKIMDIISRLPGCDGQAADEVSAYTQVRMEDAHKLLNIPKSECPDIWIRLPYHKCRNHGPVRKIQSFFLSGICTVILWQDCHGQCNSRRSYWSMAGRQFQIGNVSLRIVKKDFSYLCMWDDIKLAGKKQNLDPMWKALNKEVDLGEPTSFLDHVYLGCTQRQCQISKDIVDNYRTMFESRIHWNTVGKKFHIGNVHSSTENKDYSYLCMWTI